MIDAAAYDAEVSRHYSADPCPDGCAYCETLARVDDMLKVPDGEDVWPPEEHGGEGGGA